MTEESTADFFDGVGGGSGSPTAQLKEVGDYVHGEIVSLNTRDYFPYGKKEPEKLADGSIRQQLVIVLQTDKRNWEGVSRVPQVDREDPSKGEKDPSEDDGRRVVYVPKGKNIFYAIGNACTAAGSRPEVGGVLGVKVVGFKDIGHGKPMREHQAVYEKKAASAAFFETRAPEAQQAEAMTTGDPWATSGTTVGTSKAPF